jgi:dihydroxyacid dehydratase/phosphogluconate dehydratase
VGVSVSTTAGSATLAYQVDRTAGVVTVSAQDLTTSGGLAALAGGLAVGAPVKVSAVPQADGTLKAYAITYFTGDLPR